jgi:type III pantothenate kinase
MNLVIDYGNTLAKVGIFDHETLIEKHTFSDPHKLHQFLDKSAAENFLVSSVNADEHQILTWAKNAQRKFVLHHTLPLPITNLYTTPQTLGVDRLAGVCGAHQLFPKQHCLVIDAGTCITFDFADSNGNYHGGAISPGMIMRFQAVHTFTARLPLVSPTDHPELIGDSTETCIQSGVINGLLAETKGIIQQYSTKFDGLKVILCGGDAQFFENKLKGSIFAVPDLVLVGLNSILIYNVNRS